MTSPILQTPTVSEWLKKHRVHRFEHPAMATIFEIYLSHPDLTYAAQAVQASFTELDRLEQELSRFMENSDVTRINRLTRGESVKVGWDTYSCLQYCQQIYEQTQGAFDITVGYLVDFWRGKDPSDTNSGKKASGIQDRAGMNYLKLNESDYTVKILREGLNLDLGGIGKGYALDIMAGILKEWGLNFAILHSGFSTVLALSAPEEQSGWPVSITHPETGQVIKILSLSNQVVSGSGTEKGVHIINPGTGYPVKDKIASWVLAPIASRADALSTAFMVMSMDEIEEYINKHKNISACIIKDKPQKAQRKTVRTQRIINYGQPFGSHL